MKRIDDDGREMMRCWNCGDEKYKDEPFCHQCGKYDEDEPIENKIYIEVGYETREEKSALSGEMIPPIRKIWDKKYIVDEETGKKKEVLAYPEREIIVVDVAKRTPPRHDKKILAVYSVSELHKEDIILIRSHTFIDAEYKGKKIRYWGFTHKHYLETIRERKLKLINELDLEDDWTIFGRVEKKVIVPEQVIPEHEEEVWVEWDDWNDDWQSSNYDYRGR